MDAIAMANRLVALHLETDQHFLRVGFPPDERLATDKILVLRGERHGKADTGLERIGLVAEFVAGKRESCLDAQHIQRLQSEWHEPVRLAGLPDRVEHSERVLGMAEDLVAE